MGLLIPFHTLSTRVFVPLSKLGPPPLPPWTQRGGGQHSLAAEVVGGSNSDDWTENLGLCILCAPIIGAYEVRKKRARKWNISSTVLIRYQLNWEKQATRKTFPTSNQKKNWIHSTVNINGTGWVSNIFTSVLFYARLNFQTNVEFLPVMETSSSSLSSPLEEP